MYTKQLYCHFYLPLTPQQWVKDYYEVIGDKTMGKVYASQNCSTEIFLGSMR